MSEDRPPSRTAITFREDGELKLSVPHECDVPDSADSRKTPVQHERRIAQPLEDAVLNSNKIPALRFELLPEDEYPSLEVHEPAVIFGAERIFDPAAGALYVPTCAHTHELTAGRGGIVDMLEDMRANDEGECVISEGESLHAAADKRALAPTDRRLRPGLRVLGSNVREDGGKAVGAWPAADVKDAAARSDAKSVFRHGRSLRF